MSYKPNPYEKPQNKLKEKIRKRKNRITYTSRRDAKNAAIRKGGNSRPYRVKEGWRTTSR
jgi:hypothetical protein